MAQLLLKQVRSANGASPKQRDTLRTLGLGKIGRTTEREENDVLKGMVAKVSHLVKVENG